MVWKATLKQLSVVQGQHAVSTLSYFGFPAELVKNGLSPAALAVFPRRFMKLPDLREIRRGGRTGRETPLLSPLPGSTRRLGGGGQACWGRLRSLTPRRGKPPAVLPGTCPGLVVRRPRPWVFSCSFSNFPRSTGEDPGLRNLGLRESVGGVSG